MAFPQQSAQPLPTCQYGLGLFVTKFVLTARGIVHASIFSPRAGIFFLPGIGDHL